MVKGRLKVGKTSGVKKDEQTAAGSSVSVDKAHGEKKSLIDKLAKKEGSSSQVVQSSNSYLPN